MFLILLVAPLQPRALHQISSDLEDVIGVVHQYPVTPWNKILHFALPWATEVRYRTASNVAVLMAAFPCLLHVA